MLRTFTPLALAAGLAAPPALAHDARPGHPAPPAASGPADGYAFPLAAPGTYALPPIRPAADAALLDATGAPVSLGAVMRGRITVLAFVYTRCGDICPLASARMAELQALAAAGPRGELQLVSLSFDPAHDTPARMADYAAAFGPAGPGAPDWHFLTAPDAAAIAPVLAAYGQPVAARPGAAPAGPLAHLLRVFLVDRAGIIRNIYSADFLDARLVLNDVETLRLEARAHN